MHGPIFCGSRRRYALKAAQVSLLRQEATDAGDLGGRKNVGGSSWAQ